MKADTEAKEHFANAQKLFLQFLTNKNKADAEQALAECRKAIGKWAFLLNRHPDYTGLGKDIEMANMLLMDIMRAMPMQEDEK